MSFGLVVSGVTRSEQEAIQGVLAAFIPTMLLSGTLWPAESMPRGVKELAQCLPQTLAVSSMRGLMTKVRVGFDSFLGGLSAKIKSNCVDGTHQSN